MPTRHLIKEDGSKAGQDEALEFSVIEFSKENRKIVLSHLRTYQAATSVDKKSESKSRKPKDSKAKIQNENVEKQTLGDLEALASLIQDDKEEKPAAKKTTKAKTVKKEVKEDKPKVKAETKDADEEKKDLKDKE